MLVFEKVIFMDVFIARQPIFDRNNKVIAYELLFRSDYNNLYNNDDGDKATLDVIYSLSTIGIDNVICGKKAFINFTDKLIKDGIPEAISPDILVVEILETVEPSFDIVLECQNLKQLGYRIALDDFVFDEKYKELIDIVDIIKIDFRITKGKERRDIINRLKSKNIKFLAEKVETIEEFNEAIDYGYSYFQGYYFSKPVIITGKGIPTNKLVSLRILQELVKSELNIKKIEELVLRDVSIPYKFFKLINSSAYGFNGKIGSISRAIALIGENETRKWLYAILMKNIAGNKNDELITCSLIRAKFAELIVNKCSCNCDSITAYIMGIFSLIDSILSRPISDVLNEIFLPSEVNAALLGENNYLGTILNLIKSYERGEWDKTIIYSEELSVSSEDILDSYIEAIKWVKNF